MKRTILTLVLLIFLSACSTKTAQTPATLTPAPKPTETSAPTPSPTATSTVTQTPTATMEPDYSVDYEKVKADPWTATEAEKAGYDTYVRQQLAVAGIENAETLPDYELLEAVIEYQQQLIAKGGLENPEDYLVELPLSLHELIRTDMDNVVAVHRESSRDNATYGIGGTSNITKEELQRKIIAYPDLSVYSKSLHLNAVDLPINGDLVLLYKTPGMDPSVGIGAVLRMCDGDKVAYVEVFIPTSNAPISPGDMCVGNQVGEAVLPKLCPVEAQRTQSYLTGIDGEWKLFDLSDLIKTISENDKYLKLEILSRGSIKVGSPMWSDGITIADNVNILK